MQIDLSILSTRFDHILSEIEIGRALSAVATLSGLLDAICGDQAQAEQCRDLLLSHPLGDALLSPLLDDAVTDLGFIRAERARHELTNALSEKVQRAEERICLFERKVRGGRCSIEPPYAFARSQLDSIYAPAIADDLNSERLIAFSKLAAKRLKRGGQFCLSAFAPGHLGQGWQTIWLGRTVHCHSETTFTEIADVIGATVHCFRDASGGLIWADFSLKVTSQNGGN